MNIETVHDNGVKRHGAMWARSNQRAVDALSGAELQPWSPGVKDAVPRILLRVLDGARLDGGDQWLPSADDWTPQTAEIQAKRWVSEAAPEMLAALKIVADMIRGGSIRFDTSGDPNPSDVARQAPIIKLISEINAAIDKAEGRLW